MNRSHYICAIKGKNYSRFLKTLNHLKIAIYQITYQQGILQIEVDEQGYQKLCKMRTTYEIECIRVKGKAKGILFFKRYHLFLLALFLGFCLLLFLSNLIWKIEVVHTKEEIRTLLLEALEEQNVRPFRFKLSYQEREKVKAKILEAYKDKIEWLEIEEVGTKYYVRVEERKMKTEEEDNTPRNIIASKDAMILSIVAEQGEVVAKKFDTVKKGDLLISGIIHKEEEAKSKVKAKGEVFGEVWYTVSVLLPINHQEEKILGKPKKRWIFHFLDSAFTLEKNTYRTRDAILLFQSPLLPISLRYETIVPTEILFKHYNLQTGEQAAIKQAKEKLKVKLKENSTITFQKVLKKEQKGSKIYVEVFFKVKEEITTYQSLAQLDLAEENKKQEETG